MDKLNELEPNVESKDKAEAKLSCSKTRKPAWAQDWGVINLHSAILTIDQIIIAPDWLGAIAKCLTKFKLNFYLLVRKHLQGWIAVNMWLRSKALSRTGFPPAREWRRGGIQCFNFSKVYDSELIRPPMKSPLLPRAKSVNYSQESTTIRNQPQSGINYSQESTTIRNQPQSRINHNQEFKTTLPFASSSPAQAGDPVVREHLQGWMMVICD